MSSTLIVWKESILRGIYRAGRFFNLILGQFEPLLPGDGQVFLLSLAIELSR